MTWTRLVVLHSAFVFATACTALSDPASPTQKAKADQNATAATETGTGGKFPLEALSLYGNPASYEVDGIHYRVLDSADGYVERGIASWYGPKFHGKETSNKEIFDMHKLSAAHKTLPLPSWVRVTHLRNGNTITVRVNDRGPFKPNRIIDLSYQAAKKLGIRESGIATVEVRALQGPSKTAPRQPLYLQLAAFSDRANAVNFRSKLAKRGMTRLTVRNNVRNDRLFRVLHGPLKSAHEVEQAIKRLRVFGITKTTPIPIPTKEP